MAMEALSKDESRSPIKTMTRSTEIDFLRGIAVILVLFRHHWVGIDWLQNMGWIGVDLFFTLSGFLVSGLLFSEYKKFGSVKPGYFLIRRGFKIYPLFYTSILITAIYLFLSNSTLNYKGKLLTLLPEVFFFQNYKQGFWGHHWSLAVEEHFYILLSIVIYLLVKSRKIEKVKIFTGLSIFIFTFCLTLRILSNIYLPENENFDETHLRIDSLFAGVCLGYAFHFHKESLVNFYARYKPIIISLCFIPLAFTPFVEVSESFFIKTIGFTLLYISFTSLLMVFLFGQIKIRSSTISTIGFYSYSIYLFHLYAPKFLLGEEYVLPGKYSLSFWTIISFLIFFASAVILGILSSKLIEIPFLKIRDKYFPRRSA